MRWRERNLLNLALLAGIALVSLGIFHIWWGTGRDSVGTQSTKGPEVPLAPILRNQEPPSSFAVVAARNLFSKDRRGPAQEQAKNQDNLEGYQLLGTIIIGRTRAALIGSKMGSPNRGPEIEVIHQGEAWGGFKVVSVSNEAVVFQGKEGRRTLNFPE